MPLDRDTTHLDFTLRLGRDALGNSRDTVRRGGGDTGTHLWKLKEVLCTRDYSGNFFLPSVEKMTFIIKQGEVVYGLGWRTQKKGMLGRLHLTASSGLSHGSGAGREKGLWESAQGAALPLKHSRGKPCSAGRALVC